jgi:hypothetical protein
MAASARGVTALQLSPNRRYLAAAEQVGEGEAPSVSVYNVLAAAEKREHSLGLTEHTASLSVSALSFRCEEGCIGHPQRVPWQRMLASSPVHWCRSAVVTASCCWWHPAALTGW